MTDLTYDEKILQAIAEDELEQQQESNLVTLGTGVVLRVKAVPVLRVQAIVNKFKYPKVPELYDDKKDRMIRNPNSPEYLEERSQVAIERTVAIIDAVVATGTEVVSVPKSLPSIESKEWVEELIATQVLDNIPVSKSARYLAWVKYVAIKDDDDMMEIARLAGLNVGASEVRVAGQLQSSFPD